MSMLKSRKSIVMLIAAVVVVLAAIRFVGEDPGALLIEQVESRGSRLLGARLDISGAEVDAGAGRISLSGLTVANPGGFSSADMMSVEDVALAGDLEQRVMDQITFSGVTTMVEFRGAQSNLGSLGERIADDVEEEQASEPREESEAQSDTGSDGQDPAADDADGDGWRIERVEFSDINIQVRADWTSEVLELDAGGLVLEDLDAGANDVARVVAIRFLHKVLVAGAEQVGDDRLKGHLLEKAQALRVKLREGSKPVLE